MLNKIKNYYALVTESLHDVRAIGLLLFACIVLLISWSGVKVIETNYQLQKQISVLRQQVAVQQLQNNNLKLQNQYYNTNQYLELSARQNFGMALPGEKEIIVPKSVALAHTVTLPTTPTPEQQRQMSLPFWQRNINAWIDFFLHRGSTAS